MFTLKWDRGFALWRIGVEGGKRFFTHFKVSQTLGKMAWTLG